jgi:hypothetical protein
MRGFSFSCNKTESHSCEACRLGKHVRLPFSSSSTVASFPFQLLHSDVWTSPIPSNSGFTYYLVILDDYLHFVWTFPLRRKSDVPATLTSFSPMYPPNLVDPSTLSKLIMAKSLITSPFVL